MLHFAAHLADNGLHTSSRISIFKSNAAFIQNDMLETGASMIGASCVAEQRASANVQALQNVLSPGCTAQVESDLLESAVHKIKNSRCHRSHKQGQLHITRFKISQWPPNKRNPCAEITN